MSTATVSRCLNEPHRVLPATRKRVEEVVAELGYTPNFGARALVAGRTNTIGAIIPTMENAIFARGVQAFQEGLNERGVTLLVASSLYRQALEEEQIRNLMARGVDGIMLIGYQRKAEIYEELRKRGIHSVVTWAYDPEVDLPAVGFDNEAAMAVLADHVIGCGHKSLAVISARTPYNDRARKRVDGIRSTLRRHGMEDEALPVVETTYSIDAGSYAFSELMDIDPRPTAVMCGNDVLAVGAIREARRRGMRVPEDISITGFDDIEIATVVEPELTTVHVPHREMGSQAAAALLEMIKTGEPARSIKLPTSLQIRGSLGPPATA